MLTARRIAITLLLLCPIGARAHTTDAWVISTDGTRPWRKINTSDIPLAELRFPDFDGNGKTDVFRTDGSTWFVATDGVGQWTPINTSGVPLSELRFGDFDGNGKSDVLRIAGGVWNVSIDGVGKWKQLNTSAAPLSELRLGDFDGNGKTDILHVSGGQWKVSYDGIGQWKPLNTSGHPLSEFRIADFDGNKKSDVLRVAGGVWTISYDGVGKWKPFNTSSVPLSELRIADFDGNGKADIFRADGQKWYVAADGVGQWDDINTSGYGVADLLFGDFDGNGKSDVFGKASQHHVGLSVRRFTTSTLSNANADTILAAATTALEINNGSGDRACLVHFVRAGTVTTFGTGDGSIDSKAEFDAVKDLPGRVKVVNQINWCSGITSALGCAPSPGNTQVVVRTSAGLEGIVWAHEYGHTRGLPDIPASATRLMSNGGGAMVTAAECAAFKQ